MGDLEHTHRTLPYARWMHEGYGWLALSVTGLAERYRVERETVVEAIKRIKLFRFIRDRKVLAKAHKAGIRGSFLVQPHAGRSMEAFQRHTDMEEYYFIEDIKETGEDWFRSTTRIVATNRSRNRTLGDYSDRRVPVVPSFRIPKILDEVCEYRLPAALLLAQLVYWAPKATQYVNGQPFIANSREMWSKQLGMPVKTVRGAIDYLKARQLVLHAIEAFGENYAGQDRRMHFLFPNSDVIWPLTRVTEKGQQVPLG